MAKGKRSPLKSNPLRNPGQSLDEEINKIIDEDASAYIIISLFCIVLAGLEWWRWYKDTPPSPVLWTFMAIGITSYSIYKLLGYRKRVKNLRLGRDGERAVGQYLDLLREKGYRVFHDLVGENFNLDHVVVSEHGIYVIETKTYSKPEKGETKILFEGNRITVNGFNKNNIVSQANAQAKWLQSVIKDTTGKLFPVKPVVVFPGWYIVSKQDQKSNLWVLNPKALPTFIENSPKSLTKEEMMLVSFHISRFIRASYAHKP
jgi:hypothetical protein